MLRGARAGRRASCMPLIMLVAMTWMATFVLSRAHMMLQAYTDFHEIREDESWLLGQCKTDEFYSKMKQHSSLCDEVAHKAKDVLMLKAMRHVLDNSYLCGYDPCSELLDRVVLWALGRGLLFTVCFLAVLVLGPVLVLPMYRKQVDRVAEERLRLAYSAPHDGRVFVHPLYPRLGEM